MIKNNKLSSTDKDIWDEAYNEEFYGVQGLPTWVTLDQKYGNAIKHHVSGILPTMDISTIKPDSQGKPIRAKYIIVSMGNMDPHNWTKSQCYSPVLSIPETRLIISISVNFNVIPKSVDGIQAFFQTTLPSNERDITRQPVGCPNSKPNTYWFLLKTLYGLKRSPKHWFELAIQLLSQCNLTPTPQTRCIFYGHPINGQYPLILGLYADDFIYFSQNYAVELEFETKFKT